MRRVWARICGRRSPSPNHPAAAKQHEPVGTRPWVTERINDLPCQVDQLMTLATLDGVYDVGVSLHFEHPRMAITALYRLVNDPGRLAKLAAELDTHYAKRGAL